MNRRLTGVKHATWPVAVVVLAVASGVVLVAAPGDLRAGLTFVLVAALAAIAFVAAWQQNKLARRNRALESEAVQRADDLSTQTVRLTALHDMAQSLAARYDWKKSCFKAPSGSRLCWGVDAAHIHLIGNESQTLKLETAVGAPASFLSEESAIGLGECVCGLVASSVQPIVVMDVNTDARATRVACKRHGYCAVASVPLRSRDRAVGILTVNSRAKREFTPADLEMMTTLGNQLGAAIENAQLYSHMERRVQELSRQVEHLVIVQERERISREIHDGLAQALALLNMRVNMASSLLVAGQTEQARKELTQAAEVIDAANRDVREAITALRLTSPKGANFVPTLKEFVLDFGVRNDIQTDFASDGARAIMLAPMVEAQLMRIIQEALTNVRKHACAQHAHVMLGRRASRLLVTIEDDGRGFDMDTMLKGQNKKNFGLTTMRERAEGIGGYLDVQTLIGGGTRVIVSVPCEEAAPASETPIHETTD